MGSLQALRCSLDLAAGQVFRFFCLFVCLVGWLVGFYFSFLEIHFLQKFHLNICNFSKDCQIFHQMKDDFLDQVANRQQSILSFFHFYNYSLACNKRTDKCFHIFFPRIVRRVDNESGTKKNSFPICRKES